MEQIIIRSVSDYIKSLININNIIDSKEDYFYKEILFRGQSNEDYTLIPSLGRYKGGNEDVCHVERNMIEIAKYSFPSVFSNDLEPIELLSLLQHYGIPTRMLDLTENALVALFFACNGSPEKNGEVFVFLNRYLDVANFPIVNAIADSYRLCRGSFYTLDLFYAEIIQQPYFLEQKSMNEAIHKDNLSGGKWISECCNTPFFVNTSVRITRQQYQKGRYLLFPNKREKVLDEGPEAFVSEIAPLPKDNECIIGKISIPAEYKNEILKEIKILGIDRKMLFADSIDITCEEIKKQFFY